MPIDLPTVLANKMHFILLFFILILAVVYFSIKSKSAHAGKIRKVLDNETLQLVLLVFFLFISFSFFHELGHFMAYSYYDGNPSLYFGVKFDSVKSFILNPLFYVDNHKEIGVRETRISRIMGNFFSVIYISSLIIFFMFYKFWRGNRKEGRFIRNERDYFEIVLISMLFVFIIILLLNMNPFWYGNDVYNLVNGV